MERYFCDCLNIIVNVNEGRECVGKDFVAIGPQGEVGNLDPFFNSKLLDVKLSISGIEVSQSSLLSKRSYGDWCVSSCLNCGVDTHAMHITKGEDRVLLSLVIPHGDELLKSSRECKAYSNILKLKFIETTERLKNDAVYLTPTTMLEATEQLHNSCKKLLHAEEDAKNERIRIFTQKENQQFREYKMKANQHKEKLLSTIRNYDGTQHVRSFNSFGEGCLYSSHDMEQRDVSTDLPSFSKRILDLPTINVSKDKMIPSVENQREGPSHSLPSFLGGNLSHRINIQENTKMQKSKGKKNISHSNDDILFDMEGYNNERDVEPFFESDDESSGDATSLESSGGFSSTTARPISGGSMQEGGKGGSHIYASSLPVPVPLFNNTRHSYDPESDDELKVSPSLSRLAISFKQVAKSMQDSTGMFGDLPPRRTMNDGFSFHEN